MEPRYAVFLPSRYGVFITLVFAGALMILFALPGVLQDIGIASYLSLVQEGQLESELISDYQEASERVNTSQFAADSSVFIFWSAVGLLFYAGILALKHVFDETRKFAEEVEYAKSPRSGIFVVVAEKLLLRLVAIVLLYGWMLFLRAIMLPWVISMFAVILDGGILQGILVFASLVVAIHITVVLLRVLLLRTRLIIGHAPLHSGHR